MKLSFKLVLAFLVVGLTGVAIVALLASMTTESEFARFIFDEYRQASVEQLADYYEEHGNWNGVAGFAPVLSPFQFERPSHGSRRWAAITLVDEDGVVILPGFGTRPGEKFPEQTLANALPIEVGNETVGWVLAAREAFPESPTEALFVQRINRTLIASALGAGAISLLLGVLLARTITHPIRELTEATRALAEGDLHQEVSVRTRDELGELASSFNQMSVDLARSIDLRRQMTADIAHELRTPISVILGHVDALNEGVLPFNDETFNIIREETNRLERLVEDLRTLSRADARELTLILRPIRPSELLHQAQATHRLLARKKGIAMHVEAEKGLPEIEVDPDRMSQVFGNLLRNALRYTPAGGEIHLSATSVEDGVEFRVSDSGPGIDPEALPHIFDRFYRTDASRQRDTGGSGLGLAIAKSLVEAHGGQIRVESHREEGTTFVIQIPEIETTPKEVRSS
jgi:two-component system sensor histidine kinase BaeS